ncbi:hypothetical protein LL946_02980 [Knoellia locipacati]|uniref:hypothetical protein n=1 Tax=Knoellia locipacati TaxID=882824 RepID=UPI00384E99E6
MNEPLNVEVLPLERGQVDSRYRDADDPFSIEAPTPSEVQAEVRRCITEVSGQDVVFMLLDDHGTPWSVGRAEEQLARLAPSAG